MSHLVPRQPVPALSLPQLPEGQWTLNADKPANFTLLVFYRGLHCPLCRKSLEALNGHIQAFAELGVAVRALSCDSRERAQKTQAEWAIDQVPLAYGLSLEEARRWGLFISSAKPDSDEPALFSEPGLFLVRPDGDLYMSMINSTPFARPHFDEVLGSVEFILEKDYAARGEA